MSKDSNVLFDMFRNKVLQQWPNNAQNEENKNTVDWNRFCVCVHVRVRV